MPMHFGSLRFLKISYINVYGIPFSTAKLCAAEPSLQRMFSESQPEKASPAIVVTLDGMVIVFRDEHCANASSLIVFVPLGTETEERLVQP